MIVRVIKYWKYFVLIIICLPGLTLGSVRLSETDDSGEAYSLQVLGSSATGLTLKISLDFLKIRRITKNGNLFTELEIPGEGFWYEIGKPQLPVIRKIINIPDNTRIEWTVSIDEQEEIYLSERSFTEPLQPVQAFRRKDKPATKNDFSIDKELYKTDSYFNPGVVIINKPFYMSSVRGALLEFSPIEYNPVRNKLNIRATVIIDIRFVPDEKSALPKFKTPIYHPELARLAKAVFINYDRAEAEIQTPVNLLVIAADRFMDHPELANYLNWKRQTGYQVTIKAMSGLENSPESIKNFIISEYNGVPYLAYVLLIGDVEDVPAWTGAFSETETDVPYTQIVGDDFIPDIMIGRFSASSAEELTAIINKSISYEQCCFDDLTALNRLTFISTSDTGNWQIAEGSHDYVISNYLNPGGIQSDHIRGYSGGNTADIHQALNSGRTICHYSGHGISTMWQGPEFTVTDIGALDSSAVPFFVISNACETGSFAEEECFGESWIRAADRGAFAFVGASNSTYWEPDDIMERAMYNGYFQEEKYSIGAMVQRGLFEVSMQNTSMAKYYYDVYNILGDPTIRPWLGTPHIPLVSHSKAYYAGSGQYETLVQVDGVGVENARVTLTQTGTIQGYGLTDAFGMTRLSLDLASVTEGQLVLTVTGNQIVPFIDTVHVIDSVNVLANQDTIPVAVSSNISITVFDELHNPYSGLEIYIDGWTVMSDSLLGTTNEDGILNFRLNPKYGEMFSIKGKRPGEDYFIFAHSLVVNGAQSFRNPGLTASSPDFGVDNALLPGLQGLIQATCAEQEVRIGLRGSGSDTLIFGKTAEIKPEFSGTLYAGILKRGYTVFADTFTVAKAYGMISGRVIDSDYNQLNNVSVTGYLLPDTAQSVFHTVSAESGEFSIVKPVEAGVYRIEAKLFGYIPSVFNDTVKVGDDNIIDIVVIAAGRTTVSGTVTGNPGGRALDSEITVYLIEDENIQLYNTAQTLASEGGKYQFDLPQTTYQFSISSERYISVHQPITVEDSVLIHNFVLDTTKASILLVDDDSGKRLITKVDGTLAEEYVVKADEKGQSAAEIQSMLESLGYYVMKTGFDEETANKLNEFDLLISSSGSNTAPVEDSNYRLMLESYVANGGKLLVEGGEVGYDAAEIPGYSSFAQNVLHVSQWNTDEAKSLYRLVTDHDLVCQPNKLDFEIGINYNNVDDEDACTPASDARVIYFNNANSSQGGIILYEDPDNVHGTRIVYYTFAFNKLSDLSVAANLLENTVNYLLSSPEPKEEVKITVSQLPREFALHSNYPNPFNSSTTIRFDIPVETHVTIEIFDLLGRKVGTLTDGNKLPGFYELLWYGKDKNGKILPSGVYFYAITAGQFHRLHKMLLVK
ncbi:MAG: T9SS type A sorting domain-containing protein [Candidatus Marinimicrobia bacterium]|nr:T9SS type A sorting domain-containing protein [Candidatus Neomarinimicrobiota bacterium]